MELICKIGIYERKKVGEEGQTDGSAKMDSEGKKEARLNFDYQSLFPVSNLVSFLIHFVTFYLFIYYKTGDTHVEFLQKYMGL